MRRIEFRDNGSYDTLTGAPVFKVFFAQLCREVAQRKRMKVPLSILSLSIASPSEEGIILLNQSICRVLRKEDFYSRTAENGFWIGLRADEKGANLAAQRFTESFTWIYELAESTPGFSKPLVTLSPEIQIGVFEYRNGISAEKWIEKIDDKFFTK